MKQDSADGTRRRKRSARLQDIAAEAGVSLATVDRVLNERGSASAQARQKVVDAARRLGARRLMPDIRHGIVHLDVLMPVNDSPMLRRMGKALDRLAHVLDRGVVVHRLHVNHRDDRACADAILHPPYPRSGLALMGSVAPLTRAAVQSVLSSGEAVATLVSQMEDSPNAHYVGIDNRMAGRTAGHLLGRITRGEGRVLILRGLADFAAHREREAGCIEAIEAMHPGQTVSVGSDETNDEPDRCFQVLIEAMRQGNISAIYNNGAGESGVYRALEQLGLHRKIAWVGHELSDDHVRYLRDGVMELIIDQDPDRQVLAALYHLLKANGRISQPSIVAAGELRLFMQPNVPVVPYLG